jgi:hypothetical protein
MSDGNDHWRVIASRRCIHRCVFGWPDSDPLTNQSLCDCRRCGNRGPQPRRQGELRDGDCDEHSGGMTDAIGKCKT